MVFLASVMVVDIVFVDDVVVIENGVCFDCCSFCEIMRRGNRLVFLRMRLVEKLWDRAIGS